MTRRDTQMHDNRETQPIMQSEDDQPLHSTHGMSYRSPTEDNRRTTQQVLVPRRSGIHAVMQPGPRIALILGVAAAIVLAFASVVAPRSDTVPTDAPLLLPTLTIGAGGSIERTVVVSGTGDSGLYLRSAPQRDADVLATIAEGTVLTVTGARISADGDWLPVRMLDGSSGWVAAPYTREK
jgi:hypothetical protein